MEWDRNIIYQQAYVCLLVHSLEEDKLAKYKDRHVIFMFSIIYKFATPKHRLKVVSPGITVLLLSRQWNFANNVFWLMIVSWKS